MSSPARVVHVLGTGEQQAKGLANTVINLATHGDASRYSLSVIFLGSNGPLGKILRREGVDIVESNWTGGKRDAAGALRFLRRIRKLHPDIVHIHAGGISPRFLGKAASSARVIVHYHSLREESGRAVQRSTIGADLTIANSKATAATVRGRKPLVIYPGVRIGPRATAKKKKQGTVTIGTLGRLVPVKGLSTLLSAIPAVLNKFPDTRVEIAGDGPERERLELLSEFLGIERNVRFIGWQGDISRVFHKWDIYAQPSAAEGFGISALEAMAAGLPVVASSVGGLKEAVIDRATGLLVPPLNTKSLAASLVELIEDATLRTKLGNAARERAGDEFSIEREVKAIEAAYSRLLA